MKRDWRALGHQKPGRKAGVAHGRPYRVRDREESREKTELMVHLRVEERLTLEEIGEIFGVSREAVRLRLAGAEVDEATREKLRTGWIKERRVPPLTPTRFAKKVRGWIKESGARYCFKGRHVVEELEYGPGPLCRECIRKRMSEWREKVHPNIVRRSPEQVARMHRARWGYWAARLTLQSRQRQRE